MLQAELKLVSGKHEGQVIPLGLGKFLIGREQDCQLRPNSDLVSRHHCVFTIDEFTVRLRDLGSTNGSQLNGESIQGEVVLKAGDRVTVGNLDFEILTREVAADAVVNPPQAPTADETSQLSAGDTDHELPQQPSLDESHLSGGDTTIIAAPPAAQPPHVDPAVPQQPVYQQQPGIPYPPAQQPIGYQPVPMQYYPPGTPYPQPGMYPQQPGMYPQQPGMYPQQPGLAPPVAMPAQPAAAPSEPAVQLPDPAATGAELGDAAVTGSQGGAAEASGAVDEEANPSEHAADIIRKFQGRRPSSSS